MGKRKRKPKKHSVKKNGSSAGPVFVKHPFSGIPQEKLIKGLIEMGKASKARFQENLNKVLIILKSVEVLQTIAMLSTYGLFAGMTDRGKQSRLYKNERFNQSHVELIQALVLHLSELSQKPPNLSVIQDLFDTLPDLADLFAYQRFEIMEEELSEKQKALITLQEHLRLHTQGVRNWGFLDKVIRISKDLYKPLDTAFEKHLGMSSTQIIETFEFLIRNMEARANVRWDKFRKVFAERTVEGVVRNLKDTADKFIAFANHEEFSVAQTKMLLLSHSDLTLSDMFTFSSDIIANRLKILPALVDTVLERLSLKFGDLVSFSAEFLFLNNPVWRKPLIRLEHEKFFCAIPQIFFSFIFPVFDDLSTGNDELKQACEKRRSEFLETETQRLFKSAFPGCEIVSGFRWKDGDTEFENDLLVRIDSHLLIVEAKSGGISWPALRGAPDSAKRHIEELFFEPSIQSARLAERIRSVIENLALRDTYLPGLNIKLDEVRTVLRLSVTLEDFAIIQANLHMIKDVGWIPKEHTLAPCIILADLEIVLDILETIGEKVHYLKRRADLEANMRYVGDELDLLGLYISSGFNLGDAEFGDDFFQLTNMSKSIDSYFAASAEGFQRSKPRLRLTKWWRDICKKIEQRGFFQWTDATNILLSFSPDEQEKAEMLFKKVKKNVRKNWEILNHRCSILVIPHLQKSDALALYAYRHEKKDARKGHIENIASQALAHSHVQRVLVLAEDIDMGTYPYGAIALFFKKRN